MYEGGKGRCSRAQVDIAVGDSLIDIHFASGGFNAGFLSFGNLCDVAVHGILDEIGQSIG